MITLRNQNVAIIGQGYVGLPLAMAAAKAGWKVTGIDVDLNRVEVLNRGISPVEDVSDLELLTCIQENKYTASQNFAEVANAAVVIFCVPTPLNVNREPDTGLLVKAATLVAPFLTTNTLVVSESTSYPGTLTKLIVPTIEALLSQGVVGIRYAVAPERVNPGDQIWNQKNTPRLIGSIDQISRKLVEEFYASICENVVFVDTPEIAEAAKLLENTFRLVNIGLINEFARVCKAGNIDVHEVISAAATKPYGYMPFLPGVGVGGHCIPVDPLYLSWWARQNGEVAQLIETSDLVNRETPLRIASMALSLIDKKSPRILIVGVAYKPGVGDTRETPVLELYRKLKDSGAEVRWHDPLVSTWEDADGVPLNWDCNLIIVCMRQSKINYDEILVSKTPILDCTNSFPRHPNIFRI